MAVKKEHRGLEVSMKVESKAALIDRAKQRGYTGAAEYIRALIAAAEPDIDMTFDPPDTPPPPPRT